MGVSGFEIRKSGLNMNGSGWEWLKMSGNGCQ